MFLNYIKTNINSKENIKVSKFASFKVITKKERLGRNPKTGKEAVISERKVVSCKFSKNFKNKINNDF